MPVIFYQNQYFLLYESNFEKYCQMKIDYMISQAEFYENFYDKFSMDNHTQLLQNKIQRAELPGF